MFASFNRVIIAFTIATLSACSVGHNFSRPDMDVVRSTSLDYDKIKHKYGRPWSEGSIQRNGKDITKLSYGFGTVRGASHKGDGVAVRSMDYYFYNHVMVGYNYFSSVEQDNTDFDESKREAIIKNKTTRAEVVALLGSPSGFSIYPMISATSGEAAVYMYIDRTHNEDFKISTLRHLLVTYDVAGVVQDVKYTISTSKKPIDKPNVNY